MFPFSITMIFILGLFFQVLMVEGFVSSCALITPTPQQRQQQQQYKKRHAGLSTLLYMTRESKSTSDEEGGGSSSPSLSDLSWLRDAMDNSALEPDGLVLVETKPGIAGFAVDPSRGFVVVLVGGDRATYTVISPKDTADVRSAEALTLVQLSGGLDLGTPMLPPDILAKLVADEIETTSATTNIRELRSQVKLLRVDVIPNPDYQASMENETSDDAITASTSSSPQSTPERNASIELQGPKVLEAVNFLPGLNGEATLEQVISALQIHSDENGKLDRHGFMALLDTLRNTINAMEPSKIKFNLVVSFNEEKEVNIVAPSAMVAVGLALRYKVDVIVSEECQVEGFDVMEIPTLFPNFRPIQHLYEDAKIMDGFIPSIFNKAAPPENDDKV